jgi:hypothetical protein
MAKTSDRLRPELLPAWARHLNYSWLHFGYILATSWLYRRCITESKGIRHLTIVTQSYAMQCYLLLFTPLFRCTQVLKGVGLGLGLCSPI